MISPKLRLFLIAFFFLFGIVTCFLNVKWTLPVVLFLTALILLFGHFRHGPMLSVLGNLRKGKIKKAQELIDTIKRPDWLSGRYKGYYYFAQSLLATFSQDIEKAESNAVKALEEGNLPDIEKGILYYNLARAAYEKKQYDKSRTHLSSLNDVVITDLHLKKRIEELNKALSNHS